MAVASRRSGDAAEAVAATLMDGIVGNALGFDHQPTPDEVNTELAGFSLRPLLDRDANAPMLVINGADDVHVPQRDTLVF